MLVSQEWQEGREGTVQDSVACLVCVDLQHPPCVRVPRMGAGLFLMGVSGDSVPFPDGFICVVRRLKPFVNGSVRRLNLVLVEAFQKPP